MAEAAPKGPAHAMSHSAALGLGSMQVELRSLGLEYAHLRARDARAEALIAASLEQEGQRHPVLVVHRADRALVLIDGYRRVGALRKLGGDTVVVLVLGTCEADALEYCHRLATSPRRSVLEEGWLVRELCEAAGRTVAQVAAALGRNCSWVSRRLGLARALPESIEQAVVRGAIGTHGAMRSLVPLARANKAHAETMAAALAAARPTTRALDQLWSAYRRADAEQRARIAQEPLLFLRVTDAMTQAPSVSSVTRDVEAARDKLARAYGSLVAARVRDPHVGRAASVQRAIGRAAEACAALVAKGAEDA